ncbi:MAG: MBL fold metallo-hydrolase [Thermoleophilia bacterium]|nr:MBL fold metallo-hydrolase [Thermoleophilia bacterium]
MDDPRKDATAITRDTNAAVIDRLPFEDKRDFEEATRGFIAPLADGPVLKEDGDWVFDPHRLNFIEEDSVAPDTVNPSLWRQGSLVAKGGLFKVVDRLYQVRNLDVSNLTIIEGDTGIIVVDPLISSETASAAMDLYFEHRPKKPVVAVIHSHSHVDHYGGVRGVVDEADVIAGRTKIIAPEGFLEAAVSENVMAGNVMTRRAMFQFGGLLAADPKGTVGVGLGTGVSLGTVTLIAPTHHITEAGQRMVIDGLTFEFMPTPDTEAPAEMHWYIEELKAVTAAENCTHTLHNTYAIRGAQIRDPQAWSHYLNETIDRWSADSEVMYGMHHWPVWGRERIVEMLSKGRDAYRYINDETLRLANHGHVPEEIGEMVALPESLATHWALREYYGTINHNVKATYAKYLGAYDGNPAHLHGLPPVEAGGKYVEFMGGPEEVIRKARESFEAGEYRWVSEVMNHVVFDDPENQEARNLAADALEQMGYQTESSTWRNAFLNGAQELRFGTFSLPFEVGTGSPDTIRALTLPMIINYLGIRLNGPDAAGRTITLNLTLGDTREEAVLRLANGTLSHSHQRRSAEADGEVTTTRETLNRIVANELTIDEAIEKGEVKVEPDPAPLIEIFSLLDDFSLWFPVVEP